MRPRFEGFRGGGGELCCGPVGELAEAVFKDALEEFATFYGAALFHSLADGRAEDFVFHEVDHVGFESPFDFVFHSYYAAENDERGGGFLLLLACQSADLVEDDADYLFGIRLGK